MFLVALPVCAQADIYAAAAGRHGIDPLLFQAIAHVESSGHPWTLNIDGEPLRFQGRDDLLAYYRHVRERPVMLRTVRGGVYSYMWYGTALQAEQDYLVARREDARLGLAGERAAVLRVVKADNVDIGMMQINWIHNGRRLGVRFEALVEPKTNTEYAARILANLIRQHGLWNGVGRYHSGTPWRQQAYTRKVYNAYRTLRGVASRQVPFSGDTNG